MLQRRETKERKKDLETSVTKSESRWMFLGSFETIISESFIFRATCECSFNWGQGEEAMKKTRLKENRFL